MRPPSHYNRVQRASHVAGITTGIIGPALIVVILIGLLARAAVAVWSAVLN